MTDNQSFFQGKQAAAVLKHGILYRYPRVFATMTGSTSPGNRVVYLDGYAGPGRYNDDPDGQPGAVGSPLLAAQAASDVSKWKRNLHCLFIERNPEYAQNLRQSLAREAPESLSYDIFNGDVEEILPDVLNLVGDLPLLAFLDPFGSLLSYGSLTKNLLLRGDSLKTEVLLNLNLEMVRRVGGLISAKKERTPGKDATLMRIDQFMGGDWWRELFEQVRSDSGGSAAEAATKVAEKFCQMIEISTGYQAFKIPIRRRPKNEPLFLMILLYRHSAAPYEFNNAASMANEEWRKHCREHELLERQKNEPEDLFGEELRIEHFKQQAEREEKELENGWTESIMNNVEALVTSGRSLSVVSDIDEIFGSTLGLAREKHLRKAWDRLAEQKIVQKRERGPKLRQLTIKSVN